MFFLLRIEVLIILLSLSSFFISKIYFILILLVGVLEAVIGLTFIIRYIRYFGRDKIIL